MREKSLCKYSVTKYGPVFLSLLLLYSVLSSATPSWQEKRDCSQEKLFQESCDIAWLFKTEAYLCLCFVQDVEYEHQLEETC